MTNILPCVHPRRLYNYNRAMKVLYVLMFALLLVSCKEKSNSKVPPEELLRPNLTTDRSYGDFSVRIDLPDGYRILTFSDGDTTGYYRFMKYYTSGDSALSLSSEIEIIEQLYQIAKDSIKTNLNTVSVGYPLLFDDILKNQINAFINLLKIETTDMDYRQMRELMFKNDVYEPLNTWLKSKGYEITGLSTEKHGYGPQEELIRLGFTGRETIPVPFMVWLDVDRIY